MELLDGNRLMFSMSPFHQKGAFCFLSPAPFSPQAFSGVISTAINRTFPRNKSIVEVR
jgi:hypothetical protein